MKRLFLLLLIMILPLCMACSKPYDFEGPYLTKEIYLTNSPYGGLLGRRIKIDKRTLYIDFNEIGKLKRVSLLYDKDGTIEILVNKAKQDLNKEINKIPEFKWKMNCYTVWHSFDELNSKYIKNEDIDYTYNIYLNDIIKAHFLNNQIPTLPVHKIEKILTNKEYRNRYNIKKLPEDIFIDKLLKCFKEKDYNKKYEYAKELYDYYMTQNKDFDINNFELRSEI